MAASAGEIIFSALAFVRGTEKNRAMSALTTDHLIYEQVLGIEGGDSNYVLSTTGLSVGRHVSKLARLDALKQSVDNLVSAVEQAGDDPAALHKLGLLTQEEQQELEDDA